MGKESPRYKRAGTQKTIFGNGRYRRSNSPTSTRSGLLRGPASGIGEAGGVIFHVLGTILAHLEPQMRRTRSGPFRGPDKLDASDFDLRAVLFANGLGWRE
jgi:hypothetical protein